MINAEKINNYIGKQYDSKDFHCWHLVMELVPDAPKIDTLHKNLLATIGEFEDNIEKYQLREVDAYQDGDIIILGNNNIFHHAGVFYDNGVAHNHEKYGVIYESMDSIKRIYQNIKGLRV